MTWRRTRTMNDACFPQAALSCRCTWVEYYQSGPKLGKQVLEFGAHYMLYNSLRSILIRSCIFSQTSLLLPQENLSLCFFNPVVGQPRPRGQSCKSDSCPTRLNTAPDYFSGPEFFHNPGARTCEIPVCAAMPPVRGRVAAVTSVALSLDSGRWMNQLWRRSR
ncbi:uncharacterized protein EI97DRAFT_14238 [Westerdykella ornata]|uniref:Uncharacterized protein n=1 Tax=Westerdykella ornata TaxID=318751 RepID=A0A6A6JWF7_WESOR|nr:uncharacterized protein EI97DRAFT_14238 [Westerdykella ornata]KAF2280932.1 hypothetical protein EI97DRAFT_14238 [Westerdykella ornata]